MKEGRKKERKKGRKKEKKKEKLLYKNDSLRTGQIKNSVTICRKWKKEKKGKNTSKNLINKTGKTPWKKK